ncbi:MULTISPECIES: VC0807 family protein [unclassified Nocardia]|uniref:VC0807 family protein n=1 Tax=unclassified Nocardia TaxID=2637762 RepID=UPI001CE43C94|nr:MULTISPECIES: VC0807 family protein [unclassified Nocardia]
MKPAGLRRIAWLALDLGVSPAAFYLTQAAGVEVVRSLVIATVTAGLWLGVGMVRTRKVDALASIMMATYALMLALAAATDDPRLVLLRDPIVSAAAGLAFLGSCLTAQPATAYLARRLHGETSTSPSQLIDHRVQTTVWGCALTTESLVRVALIFLLPIPLSAGLSPAVELVLIAVLIVWTVWYRRRRARERVVERRYR